MKIKIISSQKEIFGSEDVENISLPGKSGRMQILEGHENIVSILDIGNVVIEDKQKIKTKIIIDGGFVVFRDNFCFVLADEAVKSDQLVAEEIDNAIKYIQDKVQSNIKLSELIQYEKKLRYEKFKKQSIE